MEKRDLGTEIKNIVQNAINSSNFKELNKDIGNLVESAINEVRKSIKLPPNKGQTSKKQEYKRYLNPVGQVSSNFFTVAGFVGIFAFGISMSVIDALETAIGFGPVFDIVNGIISIFFFLSIISAVKGVRTKKILKRSHRYVSRMGDRSFCQIKELATAVGLSHKATLKDLRKMITMNIFPEGHIDDSGSYFMINNQSYGEYLKLKEGIRAKKEEVSQEDFDISPEVKKVIEEGKLFVKEIRKANDDIPGEEISLKLDQLEDITGKIFDYVENHPEKLPDIRRFTEYFLPTALKLLEGYRKLELQPVKGQNISSAKREIEETMDTINSAFENLLDELHADMTMDISTDISVLKTILAQEGLTESSLRDRK